MKKSVTCALILITPQNKILLVHPTGSQWDAWSLPKGLKNEHEEPCDAAARECFEETGFSIRTGARTLTDLGRHPYNKEKDIHIFLHRSETDLRSFEFRCESKFTNGRGVEVPEVDDWRLVDAANVHKWLSPRMMDVFLGIPPSDLFGEKS